MNRKPASIGVICLFLALTVAPSVGVTPMQSRSSSAGTVTGQTNSDGTILYVGGSGPDNYTTIQAAVDAASDGDTVFVYDDSSPYLEDVVVDKSILLTGEKRNTTVLDGLIKIVADSVVVANVTSIHHMQFLDCQTCVVKYCRFEDGGLFFRANQSDIHDCIFLRGSLGLQGGDNHIHHNMFRECGDGIGYDWAGPNLIEHNAFISNDNGVYIHGGTHRLGVIVRNNTFAHNNEGIKLSEAGGHHIYNNSFVGDGISISGKVYTTYGKNFIHDNTLNGKPILFLYEASAVTIDGTINAGQVILVGCENVTVTHQTIQDASIGIRIWDCTNCHIYENNISECHWGIWLQDSKTNTIQYNNFFDNDMHAAITLWKGVYYNNWNRNYWGHWRGPLPKMIGGLKNTDWLPLWSPYEWWTS